MYFPPQNAILSGENFTFFRDTADMDETVSNEQFRALAATGSVRAVRIIGVGDSFVLKILTSAGEKTLFESEGKRPRSWKRVETILNYLRTDLGLAKATIEFEQWTPKQRDLK